MSKTRKPLDISAIVAAAANKPYKPKLVSEMTKAEQAEYAQLRPTRGQMDTLSDMAAQSGKVVPEGLNRLTASTLYEAWETERKAAGAERDAGPPTKQMADALINFEVPAATVKQMTYAEARETLNQLTAIAQKRRDQKRGFTKKA